MNWWVILFTISFVISIAITLTIIYQWIVGERTFLLHDVVPCTQSIVLSPKHYIVSTPEKGLGFSTSMWFYVRDWNYKYGQTKVIYQKGGIRVYIDNENNDLKISIPVFSSADTTRIETLTFKDIPLQKWIHMLIILDNRSLDLWMNGKLYLSKHLENVPQIDNSDNLTICPDGGFDGFLTRMIHYRYPISRLNIYSLYWIGPVDMGFLGILITWGERIVGPIVRIVQYFQRRIMRILKNINLSVTFDIDIDAGEWGDEINHEIASAGSVTKEQLESI